MKKQTRIFQHIIFLLAALLLLAYAIQPGQREIGSALIIGAVIAFAIIHRLHEHHDQGRHKQAATGFYKALGVLGLLLLIAGFTTILSGGSGIAVLDLGLGAGLLVYGIRKYLSLQE